VGDRKANVPWRGTEREMKTVFLIMLTVCCGFFCGWKSWLPAYLLDHSEQCIEYGLMVLLLGIGIDIGRNKGIFRKVKHIGLSLFLVPAGVIVGTCMGALLIPFFMSVRWNEALAVGAGFGWYSLSGILLTEFHSPQLGAVAFLSNILRELLTILSIPLIARYCGPLTLIAPGGATTMDTTLPLIARYSGRTEVTLIAFVNGLVLSALVPVLVPFFVKLG